jgi:hypothetical protein
MTKTTSYAKPRIVKDLAEGKADAKAHVLGIYNARRKAIEARKPSVGNCVLMFEDGIRFVCGSHADPTISGYEHAIVWGDRAAAQGFLDTSNIRDGNQERPRVVLAFNAKQHALAELAKVTRQIEEA